ncbi:uncharacterized protein LOC128246492 [Mya arenaria]|uniref:uncharacterized protein LOC128246492 n=1 Tax=Mya arenaria TaxID=6604 RepID=UPI0022E1B686|nr:uncharacterized protein LOC128246492 [Mya arenaria]
MKTLLLLCACTLVNSWDCPELNDYSCQLFEFSSSEVTRTEFKKSIATGEWLSIYTMEIGEFTPFGKTTNKWSKNGSKWRRATISFNQTSQKCDMFSFDYDLTINMCGWAELRQVDGHRVEQFYSQDVNSYFWWFICITPETDNGCDLGFFDLQIRDNRQGTDGEINLNGIPWDKVSADLKLLKTKTFDDSSVRYAWLGPECSFP